MRTLPIIEQHFHGAYGVDFNKATVKRIVELDKKLMSAGIGGYFPTLVTDSLENIKRQIGVIKEAAKHTLGILGIHLEGIFINPLKKGIHNPAHFLPLTVENYKQMEDDFIKIVTLAPELDEGLIDYLKSKGVKVQSGHCIGWSSAVDGVTHIFNAMSGVSHRDRVSTALSALINDNVYTEVIGDGVHVNDDALKLIFKSKPEDKILLISDALPITYSDEREAVFADSKIFYDGQKAVSSSGTLAGSTRLLPEIIKILAKKGLFKSKFIENSYDYHNIPKKGSVEWDDDFNIVKVDIPKIKEG